MLYEVRRKRAFLFLRCFSLFPPSTFSFISSSPFARDPKRLENFSSLSFRIVPHKQHSTIPTIPILAHLTVNTSGGSPSEFPAARFTKPGWRIHPFPSAPDLRRRILIPPSAAASVERANAQSSERRATPRAAHTRTPAPERYIACVHVCSRSEESWARGGGGALAAGGCPRSAVLSRRSRLNIFHMFS